MVKTSYRIAMRRLAIAALAALVSTAAPLGLASARAQPVEVDINKGVDQVRSVAVPPFAGPEVGARIAEVVSQDLERSGFFHPFAGTPPEAGLNINTQPRFDAWRAANVVDLVNGAVTADADGRLRVDFRLWDTSVGSQLIGTQFTSSPDNWRRVAHKIADAVYTKLTGYGPYFDTRIVFVAESGPRNHRVKRLAIMDQDGANPSYLTNGAYIVLNPRFSASNQQITYAAMSKDAVKVYLFDIETGRREIIGNFVGQMAFAPRFSPDGSKVVLSVEKNGNTDLYSFDLRSRTSHRLTSDPSIDTSPSYSPDGSRIVFTSDRGGKPQLYVMSAEGGEARRITFGGGQYTTPVWSPKGDLIAATKQTGGSFHIVTLRPDGSGEHVLTSNSDVDEGPTWAPNGRVLMFSRETGGGGARLMTVDATGQNLRKEPYPGGATDPAWSPLLR
jgi:TolB protein